MFKKKIINGCDSRGDGDSPYLTRYTLLETRWGNLYLHHFHRSDNPEDHDHPWSFWSVVLWPGYYEVTPQGKQRRWPLVPAYRPATWRHRVQLKRVMCRKCFALGKFFMTDCANCAGRGVWERPCWTLIWVGPKVRDWGFFTKAGWQDWQSYFREKGC